MDQGYYNKVKQKSCHSEHLWYFMRKTIRLPRSRSFGGDEDILVVQAQFYFWR